MRASVAFQVSKLASLLSKGLRQLAKQEAWDALVTGGYLVGLDALSFGSWPIDAAVSSRRLYVCNVFWQLAKQEAWDASSQVGSKFGT